MGAAGRPEYGRCRSSPMRAPLPVVWNPGGADRRETRALPVVRLPVTKRNPSSHLDRSIQTEMTGAKPVVPSVGYYELKERVGPLGWKRRVPVEHWQRELELGWTLPVVPNPGVAGRPESGRYRSSRIRALPVVPLPATTRKASWRLEQQHRPRDGDNWVTARRQPSCRSDDRFWERKVRDEHWERELELGWALPVDTNAGRCRSSPIRALPVVWNPGGADRPEPGRTAGRPECGRCRSSHCQLLQGKRVGAWTGAQAERRRYVG